MRRGVVGGIGAGKQAGGLRGDKPDPRERLGGRQGGIKGAGVHRGVKGAGGIHVGVSGFHGRDQRDLRASRIHMEDVGPVRSLGGVGAIKGADGLHDGGGGGILEVDSN